MTQSTLLVGYARVSTTEQNLDLQLDALQKAGCHKVFEDTTSGAKAERPGLNEALGYLRPGDTLIVWKLDRLGRSLAHLISIIQQLKERGVMFRSLQDGIDTSTSQGQFFFHVTGAFAELERNLIRERTNAGLKAARARGRMGGRPKAISKEKWTIALKLYQEKQHTVQEICQTLGMTRRTFYRYLGGQASTAKID